jgi:DNA repair protein RecO (recombination protein O)
VAKTLGDSSAGFVLHSYPYLETSLIVETFTRSHGRVVAVAKGAKRPTSAMKSRLNPFQGLLLTWFGKSDLKTLKTVEHAEIYPQLSGAALMSAFYMNELLLKLAQREDAHEALYDAYEDAIVTLTTNRAHAEPGAVIAIALRKFEMSLLSELGYALQLTEDADTHDAIDAGERYVYVMERGPVCVRNAGRNNGQHITLRAYSNVGDGLQLSGKTLLDLAVGDFRDPQTQAQAKLLMRRAINQLLGDKPLHTRQLIRDLKDI